MGSFGVFVRHISAPETTITLARFGFGFSFLGLGLIVTGQWRAFKVRISRALLLSGICIALCIVFYSKALKSATLAGAAFLLYLAPLLATLLAWSFLRERLTKWSMLLIALAFSGSLLLLQVDWRFEFLQERGNFYALASAVFYALFITVNRSIAETIPVLTRALYQLLFGALTVLPFLKPIDLQFVHSEWTWLLAVGFFQGFLALTLMITALRFLRAYEYGTIAYFEPIVASLAGYWFYREQLSPCQIGGCAMIILSGLLQSFSRKR